MADDVKVKFGGDFSGIAGGAASAGKIAGTAISASFKAYTESLTSGLANMFSVTNIMGKMFAGVKDALKYFREIDELSRQLNVSRVDLQKFGKIGAEVGISMETMGRSIQFANKTIGAATIAAGSQRETLKALGFTEEEITSGKVKALDVMMKLSAEYDNHIDKNVIAKHTVDMFGRSGGELTKILSEGTSALKERIATMKVYSEEEVKSAARLDRSIERLERQAKAGMKSLGLGISEPLDKVSIDRLFAAAQKSQGIEENWFGDTIHEQIAKKPGSLKAMAEEMIKEGAKKNFDKNEIANLLIDDALNALYGPETTDLASMLSGVIRNMTAQEGKKKPAAPDAESALGPAALAVSSLQAIGGGDIGSIMSGLHVDVQQEQLEVQKQIATNTTPPSPGASTTIVPVAK
jgi:hypothetical protein